MKHSETMGPYRLADCIGHGGMAMVYRAQRQGAVGARRQAVVKVLLPHLSADHTFVKMFSDEARLSAQLNHRNIVRVDEFGVSQGTPWIAMEYLEGRNLQQIYAGLENKHARLPIGLGLFIGREMCNALAFAHDFTDEDGVRRTVVHRDVSPSNVMLCKDGSIKLLDFGVARPSTEDYTQTFRGKFAYMAPEQLERHPIDPRSDVFAAGVVLHELLTGQRLFAAHCDAAILVRLQQFQIPYPTHLVPMIPVALSDVVMKALARDPRERYRDAGELCEALAQFEELTLDSRALLRYLDEELPETWHAETPVAALPTQAEILRAGRRGWMLGASALMCSMLPGAPGTHLQGWENPTALSAPAFQAAAQPKEVPAPITLASAAPPALPAPLPLPAPAQVAPPAEGVPAEMPPRNVPAPRAAAAEPRARTSQPIRAVATVVRKKIFVAQKVAPELRRPTKPASAQMKSARRMGFVDPFAD